MGQPLIRPVGHLLPAGGEKGIDAPSVVPDFRKKDGKLDRFPLPACGERVRVRGNLTTRTRIGK
ncbi:hypothetical protein CPY51_14530 [Rhizobium tubonense]|uniref:Uncharacterized protein n=1 Tax=Rhizobium tubonense TaxID=484088 RepID=A0A2W4CUT1_9HYPH|nr:hypothetical protein CPY51_14530 [Rhizobium tubonense]